MGLTIDDVLAIRDSAREMASRHEGDQLDVFEQIVRELAALGRREVTMLELLSIVQKAQRTLGIETQ